MDFELTEEQKMLKANARDFLEKEIIPIADEYDRKGPLSREEAIGFIKKLMPFGYLTGLLPEGLGGAWLDNKTDGILVEELSRAWAGLAGVVISGRGGLIALFVGTEESRKRIKDRVAAGEYIGCLAITEPNAGSDTSSMETTAVREGDTYVINGTKTWISSGSIADVVLLFATTDRSKGRLGITPIIVEKEVSPFTTRQLNKLGLKAWPTAELSFVDCRVPKENVLGGNPAQALGLSLGGVLDSSRCLMALIAVGISQAAVDAAIKYARERKQFGRPIGSFQMIQEMIVDMIAETEAMRLLTYRAFDLIDKGERCRWQSSLAKAYAPEMAVNVASKAIQIHGAMGLSDEYPVERYFRDARMMTILDGTTQINKLVVGREVIGIRAFV
ncbi:MAG: acyl-CoA dehydrogenase family protein [Dehalococcoidia bacterium]|nr:acyl-CoA dehydrogenase family protein [Dehalococcoidia bacterium]